MSIFGARLAGEEMNHPKGQEGLNEECCPLIFSVLMIECKAF
jgi:hypothetical protein